LPPANAANAFGIKTGTLVKDARRLCPGVIPVEANHRLYTDYHERILKAVDTCLPVEKVMSIDEMACRLMGTERQVAVARELALKVKRALREQVGECDIDLDPDPSENELAETVSLACFGLIGVLVSGCKILRSPSSQSIDLLAREYLEMMRAKVEADEAQRASASSL
jgi:DNA-binding transcriptional MerR regulator